MKKLWFLSLALFMTVGLCAVPPGTPVGIRGTLILASNEGQSMDSSLQPYASQLKRLNFASYRVIGKGVTKITVPGNGGINLGGSFAVAVQAQASPNNRIPVDIRWTEGNRTLIHTSGSLPLVLGGPGHQNGTLILILDGQ